MRKLILAVALATGTLPLAGCGALLPMLTGMPAASSPAAVANRTTLDETALRLAETAYAAERTALDIGADAGLLTGSNAAKAAALDNKAYAALGLARRAYSAANAADFADAVSQLRDAVTGAVALVKK